MYGTVKWLNASDALGKIKKGVEMLTVVFIFKSAVVLLAHERIKAKKKSKVGYHPSGRGILFLFRGGGIFCRSE